MKRLYCLLSLVFAMLGSVAYAYPMIYADGRPVNANFRQLSELAIGGEGGWDYLTCDSDTGRLYIARESRVQVVDLETGRLVAEVANTPGVHGIALVTSLHRGFTSSGKDNTVTVFSMKSNVEIHRIVVGKHPDAIVFDPATRRVFTMNAGSNDVTAISAVKARVVGTIPLGGRPEFAAVDGHGRLYVNLTDTNEIAVIDTANLKLLFRWSLAPGEHPTGLAIDTEHHRLFSVCGNEKMIVMDALSGRIVDTKPIGNGPDAAAFDPATGYAFSSNGRDGTLTIIREDAPDTINMVDTVATQQGARTMALDIRTHRIYLVTARFAPLPAGADPHQRPAIEPDSFTVLVYGNPPPIVIHREHIQTWGVRRHRWGY